MSKNRKETWLMLAALAVGATVMGTTGLWLYVRATATPLHPHPGAVPSVIGAAASSRWAGAVQRGRQIARTALAEQNLPGLSVAVGIGGDIVWTEGFGWADLEHRVSVTPEMRFRIGTASMMLTSAAVGLLVDKGRLRLDEKIQTYVPEFTEQQWPVRLRQLMGHLGGIANDGGDEGPLFTQHCERPADALQFLSGRERQLRAEPGSEFHYSSYGWILVSAAVEAVAGEPFLSYMHRQIFEPLGMGRTEADSTTASMPERVNSYFPRFAAQPRYGPDPMRPLDYSCYAGSSVFLSTPSDLVRFGMAITTGKLLQPATVQLLQTSQRLTSGQETGYGLGWDLEKVVLDGKETLTIGHDGELLGGMVASLQTFPGHGMVVSVVSNISYAGTFAVASKIAEAFTSNDRTIQ